MVSSAKQKARPQMQPTAKKASTPPPKGMPVTGVVPTTSVAVPKGSAAVVPKGSAVAVPKGSVAAVPKGSVAAVPKASAAVPKGSGAAVPKESVARSVAAVQLMHVKAEIASVSLSFDTILVNKDSCCITLVSATIGA